LSDEIINAIVNIKRRVDYSIFNFFIKGERKGVYMEQYRVLLVDDELEIRDGMEEKVDWEGNGFLICGVAENGREAYELAMQLTPDVILTDIKMPFMDGLELSEKVLQDMPKTKIVVFSGFDDFEYAQKAIELGVEEYILKPISAKALEDSLQKLKIKMDEEIASKRNVERLQQMYNESYPALQEHFLINIMEGFFSDEEANEKAKKYGKEITKELKTVCVINYDGDKDKMPENNFFRGREELIPVAIKKNLEEALKNRFESLIFHYYNNIVVVVALDTKEELVELTARVNETCREIRKMTGIGITAGIGNLYHGFSELKYSYQEAFRALDYSILLNDEAQFVVGIKDINKGERSSTPHVEEYQERNLISAIKSNNVILITEIIEEYFQRLKESGIPYYQYHTYVLELFAILLKLINSYQCDYDFIFVEGDTSNISSVLEGHSLDYICEWMIKIASKVADWLKRERLDMGKDLVTKAKAFIEENYTNENCSLEELCKNLHVNPTYFSSVFKKETGENFITHLTELRINMAAYLLDSTEDKTYIIAAKVGYTEPNYFSYLFKKKTGMSPSAYRKRGEI